MRSTDIKNWSYLLSYSEMTELEDFPELLAYSINTGTCLMCRGVRIINSAGLCSECLGHLDEKDKEALTKLKEEKNETHD